MFMDETAPFELHNGLAKPERREDGTPSTCHRPKYRVALVRLKYGTYLPGSMAMPVFFAITIFDVKKL